MSFDIASLQTRLATLNANLKHTLQLVQQLSRLQPNDSPSSGRDPAVPQDEETRTDLTASIHEQLKSSEDELEVLQQDVTDLDGVQTHTTGRSSRRSITLGKDNDGQREIARCLGGCEKLREDLKLTRTRFRRAQLTAKASADRAVQHERASYLSSLQAAAATLAAATASQADTSADKAEAKQPRYTDLFAGRRPRPSSTPTTATQDDILLTAASDVTAGLRRTHDLLQTNVTQSQFARETLETSNEALKELNTRYDSFEDLIAKSRGLLGTLLRSQKSDTWYLQTACYLLTGVIAWLVFRRWVYGPFWWLFWMPLKLVFNMFWGVGYVLGVTGGKNVQLTAVGGTTVLASTASSTIVSPSFTATFSSGTRQISTAVTAASVDEDTGTMVEITVSAAPSGSDSRLAEYPDDENDGGAKQEKQDNAEPMRRGDGQVLPERDEATQPRNPKKRMMEQPIEEDSTQQDSAQKRKDEL